MFMLSIVLEERNDHGELREYHKHEVTDPEAAFRFSAYLRTYADVEPDIRKAADRARPFFLRGMVEDPVEPEPAEPAPETSDCPAKNTLYCSFCGKSEHEVAKVIPGPCVFICNECVELCNAMLRDGCRARSQAIRQHARIKKAARLDGPYAAGTAEATPYLSTHSRQNGSRRGP